MNFLHHNPNNPILPTPYRYQPSNSPAYRHQLLLSSPTCRPPTLSPTYQQQPSLTYLPSPSDPITHAVSPPVIPSDPHSMTPDFYDLTITPDILDDIIDSLMSSERRAQFSLLSNSFVIFRKDHQARLTSPKENLNNTKLIWNNMSIDEKHIKSRNGTIKYYSPAFISPITQRRKPKDHYTSYAVAVTDLSQNKYSFERNANF